MRTPLAWHNLIHGRVRTLLALAGVSFAVLLMFVQLGFRGSADQSATLIYDALRFDILIESRHYLHLVLARSFPRHVLQRAAAQPGVAAVRLFDVTSNNWRNPQTGELRAILTMGIDPEDPPFNATVPEILAQAHLLAVPEFVLIDRMSRQEFGPQENGQFGDADVGARAEIGGRRVQIAGHFALGTGFVADGAVLLGEQGYLRVNPHHPAGDVSLGLVAVAPGTDAAAVAEAIRRVVPDNVEVLTRAEVLARERQRWVQGTSLGLIFQLGVWLAVVVGASIVYQVLAADVIKHLPEYATLRAMGYGQWFLAGVVLRQAMILGLLGFLPGALASMGVYSLVGWAARIPIGMNWQRMGMVLGMSLVMCVISGMAALNKLRSAEPADLF